MHCAQLSCIPVHVTMATGLPIILPLLLLPGEATASLNIRNFQLFLYHFHRQPPCVQFLVGFFHPLRMHVCMYVHVYLYERSKNIISLK